MINKAIKITLVLSFALVQLGLMAFLLCTTISNISCRHVGGHYNFHISTDLSNSGGTCTK